ncbi:amidohydrolase [Desulfonema ishimotonii]|uniref:Amidohydrolase n=2 Tax=Desulfonema ishimotonii TaxID=45657 RepID=A0A401G3R0_9BACT|nr:amidohydrolase [Desulfonema ishimotonii]
MTASHPRIRPVSTGTGVEIHRAGWVMATPQTLFRDGFVAVENGVIREVGHGRPTLSGPVTDHGPGTLMPGLINAHTHLELSALHGRLSLENGFQDWVRQLLITRESLGHEALVRGAESGISALRESGCVGVGEISTLGLTRDMLHVSGLSGVWFREYLGSELPADLRLRPETGECCSDALAGHAPHTTGPKLLRALRAATSAAGLPFSLHLDESADEVEFLTTGKGAWADFLTRRGIDFSDWGLPVKSPVLYAARMGILDRRTLVVHLIHARKGEFEVLKAHQVSVCLCPRSNSNLHNALPDLPGMLAAGLAPCVGTDSLASADSLSLFDEIRFTAGAFPSVSPATLLGMATLNGARALGLADRFGTLTPGKRGKFIYIPVTASGPSTLSEAIIHESSA